jgi:hypothetical protein
LTILKLSLSVILVILVSNADGMGELSYQWQYSTDKEVWVNIVSATTDELTLTQTHTGKYIKVITSYTDGRGNLETTTTFSSETVALETINFSSIEDQEVTITKAQLLTNITDNTNFDMYGVFVCLFCLVISVIGKQNKKNKHP